MTDERLGEELFEAIERLPRGAGIVFRHYELPPGERRALFTGVKAAARRRGLVLVLAGSAGQALRAGADGFHERSARRGPTRLLRTMSAHNHTELVLARRAGADLAFVSPLFATRSHPGADPLGRVRFGLLAREARVPVIALGGINARRARAIEPLGIHGWAAIDAWLGIQP